MLKLLKLLKLLKYTSAPRKRVTQVEAKHKGELCLRDIKKRLHKHAKHAMRNLRKSTHAKTP